jgi:hypothetical protein
VVAELGQCLRTIKLTSESSQKQESKDVISSIDIEKYPVSISGMLRCNAHRLVRFFRHVIMTYSKKTIYGQWVNGNGIRRRVRDRNKRGQKREDGKGEEQRSHLSIPPFFTLLFLLLFSRPTYFYLFHVDTKSTPNKKNTANQNK